MKKRMKMKSQRYYLLNEKNILVISLILISFCTIILFFLLDKSISPILLNYAEVETTRLSTLIINKAVENEIETLENTSDFIKTVTNKDGEIISIDFNTKLVNSSLVTINNVISSNLKNLEAGKLFLVDMVDVNYDYDEVSGNIIYKIPMGVITDIPLLADLGPKIPVKTNMIGSVISNVRTDLTSYGINNALVSIYIEVSVTEQVIMPFISKSITTSLEIPILVKLIQGSIPEVYGGNYSVSSPLVSS